MSKVSWRAGKQAPEITSANFYEFLGMDERPNSLAKVEKAHSSTMALLRRYQNNDRGLAEDMETANKAYSFAIIREDELWCKKVRKETVKIIPNEDEIIQDPEDFTLKTRGTWMKNAKSKTSTGILFASLFTAGTFGLISDALTDGVEFSHIVCAGILIGVEMLSISAFKRAAYIKEMLANSKPYSARRNK